MGFKENLIEKQIRKQNHAKTQKTKQFYTNLLSPNGFQVVLIGSRGPLPNASAQTSTAVFVNGQFLLFDCGCGSKDSAIDCLNLPIQNLTAMFFTHYHGDHIGDFPSILEMSWINGRANRLPTYGCKGIQKIVDGANLLMELDFGYRSLHHGSDFLPLDVASAQAYEFQTPNETEELIVYEHEGVVVKAFFADHPPISPCVGYIIEFNGKKVVISGDTNKTSSLQKACQNADLFVCEAMSKDLIQILIKASNEVGNERAQHILEDVLDYHLDISEVGEIAQIGNVKQLAFNHITPPVPGKLAYRVYFEEPCKKFYNGTIIESTDGKVIPI